MKGFSEYERFSINPYWKLQCSIMVLNKGCLCLLGHLRLPPLILGFHSLGRDRGFCQTLLHSRQIHNEEVLNPNTKPLKVKKSYSVTLDKKGMSTYPSHPMGVGVKLMISNIPLKSWWGILLTASLTDHCARPRMKIWKPDTEELSLTKFPVYTRKKLWIAHFPWCTGDWALFL